MRLLKENTMEKYLDALFRGLNCVKSITCAHVAQKLKDLYESGNLGDFETVIRIFKEADIEESPEYFIKLGSKLNKMNESYNDFDWQTIKDYCFNLINEDTSKLKDSEDAYNFINNYFEPLQIEFLQAPDYGDQEWKDSYICNGSTFGGGYISIYCDFENIFEALTGTAYRKECITSIATVVVHELMHRYQTSQFSDRKWDKINTVDDYLAHKDELSAHVVGGVTELLGLGYTKDQLKKALITMDKDLDKSSSPFWESNSLYVYWDRFGSFDTKDKVWLRFKKELANFILSLDE